MTENSDLDVIDWKSRLHLIVQSKRKIFNDFVKLKIIPECSQFMCIMTIPSIFHDREFVGELCKSKKHAEQSAIKMLLTNTDATAALQEWSEPDIVEDVEPAFDYKSLFCALLQTKAGFLFNNVFEHLYDHTIEYGITHFICKLKILVIKDTETIVGPVCNTKKAALNSALGVLHSDQFLMDRLKSWLAKKSLTPIKLLDTLDSSSTSTPVTVDKNRKVVHDWKSELNHLLQKKGLIGTEFKHHIDISYIDVPVEKGSYQFQCKFVIKDLPISSGYSCSELSNVEIRGGVFPSKRQAEQSAIEAFLTNTHYREAFDKWIPMIIDRGDCTCLEHVPMIVDRH